MNNNMIFEYELVCLIINFGQASKSLKIAKNNGINGGTILLARGTAKNTLLEFLGLNDIRREVVLMIANKNNTDKALKEIENALKLKKPNHGIAFTIPVSNFLGCGDYDFSLKSEKRSENKNMFNSVFTIVDKGKGELVMEVATQAGATGGTIINARGSGIHETSKIFNMEIEPEKEIVLILSKISETEKIVTEIREKMEIDKPGNGIIFVQDVNKTYGLRDK